MIRSPHEMQDRTSVIQTPLNVTIDDYIVPDVLLKIFSILSLQDICNYIPLVSKKWSVLSNDPNLLKIAIWNETFNTDDWNRIFPDIALTEFDCKYAFDSLPNNIGAMFKGPCPSFPGKTLGQTHVFVWMPKNLSINKFKAIVKKFFPERPFEDFIKMPPMDLGPLFKPFMGFSNHCKNFEEENKIKFGLVIDMDLVDEFGDVMTELSEWLIMPKTNLIESIGGTFAEHQKIVNALELSNFKSCAFPTILEAMVSITTTFFKTDEKILDSHAIFCKETINDSPIYGEVNGSSLLVRPVHKYVSNDMSSAPIRKFKSIEPC